MKEAEINLSAPAEASASDMKMKWRYKYSDDLANLFGGLFVLSLGGIAFVLILALYLNSTDDTKTSSTAQNYLQIYLPIAIAIGAISIYLMFYFARQVETFQRVSEAGSHRNAVYVISEWSLKTLAAAGVGEDVIEYLEDLRSKQKILPKELSMTYPFEPDDWMEKLKSDLGPERVSEYEEILFKYTRRKK